MENLSMPDGCVVPALVPYQPVNRLAQGEANGLWKLSRVKESQNVPLRRFAGKGGTGIRGRATGWHHDHNLLVKWRPTPCALQTRLAENAICQVKPFSETRSRRSRKMQLVSKAARSLARQVAPVARNAGRKFSSEASSPSGPAAVAEKFSWFFNPAVHPRRPPLRQAPDLRGLVRPALDQAKSTIPPSRSLANMTYGVCCCTAATGCGGCSRHPALPRVRILG